ncbi:SigB/SigF/SigG family RNA polymerase sigma factor [Solwaraspora sp. WMMD1047]|uniref:SigB/SigF/SigG family RNA polymerase sigma factor n=1 Tax=Solwaraspora sp. WMMD1047 TaxID=3016102 RepID=UPI002415BDCE|nr:SigB/SigF/SigG family RNA polymerase sigma factor [Solwaraspora sp. WMMD1047]MDG4832809.1 SigB/SigF/SigG family RNA polymerase sigma factor [Solwaraspora sp. WMMD1047]
MPTTPYAGADDAREDLDTVALRYAADLTRLSPARRAAARDDLARQALPFVNRLARRYQGRGEPLDDLRQTARLGLVLAIDRYDPERGPFTAYATVTIVGELKRHFRDRGWGVHVPRRLRDLSRELTRFDADLTGRLARRPTVAELAAASGATVEDVLLARRSAEGYRPKSLDVPVTPERASLAEEIGDRDPDLESVDDRVTVARLLTELPAREREILSLRFYGNRTQAEIAAQCGISQMHVSRLLSQALTWLREAMLTDHSPVWSGYRPDPETYRLPLVRRMRAGVLTVGVGGEVDRDNAGQLTRALVGSAGRAGVDRVEVDLARLPLIDAAGTAALLAGYEAARSAGVAFRIIAPNRQVEQILRLAGLAPLVDR